MPLILIFLVAMLTGIYFLSENSEASKIDSFTAENSVRVTNMLIYRNAVTSFAEANPSYNGVVPDNNLSLPIWFRKMNDIGNYIAAGKAYVYAQGRSELAYALAKKTESIAVGIKKNGVLVHPSEGNTGIAVPSSVPDESVVIL